MEKITTYNYEAFYLDYLEGNLDEIETAMLFDFLNAHSDLKAELEMDDDVMDFTLKQTDDSLHRFDKEDLKYFDCKANEICLNNVADFMVADVENEISADKKIELDTFVAEHRLESAKKYFYATQLQADLKETYPNKNELKKKATVIPLWVKISSVAAVGLLLFNFLGQSPNNEVYAPRQNDFALNIDANTTPFEINVQSNKNKLDESVILSPKQIKNDFFVEEIENNTDSIKFIKDETPLIDIVKDNTPKKEIDNTPIVKNDDVAIINEQDDHTTTQNNDINLMDMYKPVTNLTNTYTSLNVSYKKSTPESDYQVTAIKIGKFSFERKRKK